jgi:NAD(P)-dependent dehydrogenase (short-subunit alcohol dehydrogenase family)
LAARQRWWRGGASFIDCLAGFAGAGFRKPGEDQILASNPFDLSGKVALVTGANAGIGLAFARGLARAGADVVIWGRRAERNAAAVKELSAFGTRIRSREVDVRSEDAVREGVDALIEEFGHIDIAVANAGIATQVPFPELSSELYHGLLNVSLHGSVYTLREVSRHMVAQAKAGHPGGSLIICGSGSIFQGVPALGHYAMAKGALAALSKTLAAELGPHGIRCNVIAPGFIATEMTYASPEIGAAIAAAVIPKVPLGRVGTPEDLEGAVVYLASDAARYHTGDTLVIDGGKLNAN